MYKKFLPNPYLRAFTGGSLVLALTFLIGNQDYNGTGIHVITAALDGQAVPYAFLSAQRLAACLELSPDFPRRFARQLA